MKNEGKKIEDYIAELNAIADRLNDPSVSLDEAVGLYKQGMTLSVRAQELLNKYQQEIEILNTTVNEGGMSDE